MRRFGSAADLGWWKFLPVESMAPAANYEGDLPLGELIARAGLVAPNDLYAALATARAAGRRLGDVLLEQGLVGERDLARLVAEQEGLEFVDLGKLDLDQRAVDLLSERTSRRHSAIAFRSEGAATIVAVADPTDTEGLDAIVAEIPGGVRFVVATASEVDAALTEAFGEAPAEAW
jgi:type IV pilus assembly protein PilB